MLRTAPSLVKLFICRPDPRILSPLPETSTTKSSKPPNSFKNSESPATIQAQTARGSQSPAVAQLHSSVIGQSPATMHSRDSTLTKSNSRDSTLTKPQSNSSTLTRSPDQSGASTLTKSLNNEPLSSQSQVLADLSAEERFIPEDQELTMNSRIDLNDTRSTISATSTTTYGTQVLYCAS